MSCQTSSCHTVIFHRRADVKLQYATSSARANQTVSSLFKGNSARRINHALLPYTISTKLHSLQSVTESFKSHFQQRSELLLYYAGFMSQSILQLLLSEAYDCTGVVLGEMNWNKSFQKTTSVGQLSYHQNNRILTALLIQNFPIGKIIFKMYQFQQQSP